MKRLFFTLIALLSMASYGFGQVRENVKTPRVLIMTADETFSAWIVSSSKRTVRYTETENSTAYVDKKLASINVYFLEPSLFTEAMSLFKSRAYKEAHGKFKECVELYKKFEEVPGNYSTLAGFYQMECSRKLQDLATLEAEMEDYLAEALLHKEHRIQLELNKVFWSAVKNKSWSRLVTIAEDPKWAERKLSGGHRAQVRIRSKR
jgi:hypothetical protein